MFQHILLPTDGSSSSEAAIRNGLQFAKSIGAKVTGLHVRPLNHPSFHDMQVPAEMLEQIALRLKALSKTYLSAVQAAAEKVGVACEVVQESSDTPHDVIVRVAEEKGCDLILMASHGRKGVSALLIGSETQKVLTHSRIPVLVYR